MAASLELFTTLYVAVDPPIETGDLPAGFRRVIPIIGGTLHGPGLTGEVLSGGADWNTQLPSGVSHLWARYTVRTDDGVLLGIVNDGYGSWQADGRFLAHTHPRIEAPAGRYEALNTTTLVVTVVATDGAGVHITWYRVVGE